MSQSIKEEEGGIQYILNDTEFILDPSELNTDEINDDGAVINEISGYKNELAFNPYTPNTDNENIIYTDGDQAVVLNGHIVQEAGETPTLVLQDGDISQYLMNDNQGEYLIETSENSSTDQPQENQIIQYVDEDGNITDPSDIVYINEDGFPLGIQEIAELMEAAQNSGDGDQLEETTMTDLDSLDVEQETDSAFIGISPTDWYQYTVVKNENMHFTLPPLTANENNISDTNCAADRLVDDVSNISGKNLLTGQVVTLESYMDKIKSRLKSVPANSIDDDGNKSRPKHNLNAFMNKKFNLGLTLDGKRLVGKIVHVGSAETHRRGQEQQSEIVNISDETDEDVNERYFQKEVRSNTDPTLDNSPGSNVTPTDQIHVQKKLLSKKSDQFQRMSKTLSGLMKMDGVKKKIIEKSMQIEIIDKYWDNAKNTMKNVSFISGYMESTVVANKNSESVDSWTFVPDTLRTEHSRGKAERKSQKKYPSIIFLTIVTTFYKNSKSNVKVFIDSKTVECRHCKQKFCTYQDMVMHINNDHALCEVCNCVFDNSKVLIEHKQTHISSGELKLCTRSNCTKYFMTDAGLKKHLAAHNLDCFKCAVCSYSGMSEVALKLHYTIHPTGCDICGDVFLNTTELVRHKKIHLVSERTVLKKQQPTKYYSCDICKRTFSRQSNLQRHVQIHEGADRLYRCAICGCSYHYVSSLTRHLVHNHVQVHRPSFATSEETSEMELLLNQNSK